MGRQAGSSPNSKQFPQRPVQGFWLRSEKCSIDSQQLSTTARGASSVWLAGSKWTQPEVRDRRQGEQLCRRIERIGVVTIVSLRWLREEAAAAAAC
jgi:hypothetical protein